jgi:hypothetical protein
MLMTLPRPRDHMPRDRLADVEHAINVGSHHLMPVVMIELVEPKATLDAGVVHEDNCALTLRQQPDCKTSDHRGRVLPNAVGSRGMELDR